MLLSPRRATSALVVLNNRLLPLKLLTYCSRLHATYWYNESKHQQWQQLWALEVQQQWKKNKKQEQCRCLQSLATQRNNKTAPFARPPLSLLLAATQDLLLNDDAALVCWGLLWCVRPIKTLHIFCVHNTDGQTILSESHRCIFFAYTQPDASTPMKSLYIFCVHTGGQTFSESSRCIFFAYTARLHQANEIAAYF